MGLPEMRRRLVQKLRGGIRIFWELVALGFACGAPLGVFDAHEPDGSAAFGPHVASVDPAAQSADAHSHERCHVAAWRPAVIRPRHAFLCARTMSSSWRSWRT